MVGLLRPPREGKEREVHRPALLSPAGISQAAALSLPDGVGLVSSFCLCLGGVSCSLFRLEFCCQKGSLAQEPCPGPLRRGVNGLRRLSSDTQERVALGKEEPVKTSGRRKRSIQLFYMPRYSLVEPGE